MASAPALCVSTGNRAARTVVSSGGDGLDRPLGRIRHRPRSVDCTVIQNPSFLRSMRAHHPLEAAEPVHDVNGSSDSTCPRLLLIRELKIPRVGGHLERREHAPGVFHGKTETECVHAGVQGRGRAPLPDRRSDRAAGRGGPRPSSARSTFSGAQWPPTPARAARRSGTTRSGRRISASRSRLSRPFRSCTPW